MRARTAVLVVACLLAASGPAPVAVSPSGPRVPANLLRISVTFAAPPPAAPVLSLRGAGAAAGRATFAGPPLWTADGRTLTVLFDPARLKTGVAANATLGPVLRPGDRVVLALDGVAVKAWDVAAPQAEGPEPGRWTLVAPGRAGTATPLLIRFDHPVDALSRDLIAVVSPDGEAVAGERALEDGERLWRFRPAAPWRAGAWRIAVSPELEDASGNTVAQPFEHAPNATWPATGPGTGPAAVPSLRFTVR